MKGGITKRIPASNLSSYFTLTLAKVRNGTMPFADRCKKTMEYVSNAYSGTVYAYFLQQQETCHLSIIGHSSVIKIWLAMFCS